MEHQEKDLLEAYRQGLLASIKYEMSREFDFLYDVIETSMDVLSDKYCYESDNDLYEHEFHYEAIKLMNTLLTDLSLLAIDPALKRRETDGVR